MISSHITNKEVSTQNIPYPIGYTVTTMLFSYMTSEYSLHFISLQYFSHKVISDQIVSKLSSSAGKYQETY